MLTDETEEVDDLSLNLEVDDDDKGAAADDTAAAAAAAAEDPTLTAINGLRELIKNGGKEAEEAKPGAAAAAAAAATEEADEDDRSRFDPDRLRDDAASRSMQASSLIDDAMDEVREKFPALPAEAIREIRDNLRKAGAAKATDVISRNGHFTLGDAVYGRYVREGKINPAASSKTGTQSTTVGGERGRTRTQETDAEAEFKSMYAKDGKLTRDQRELLRGAQ